MHSRTDVLILGAGLAGLRAAWAAAEACPGLEVTLATLLPGPSGSSFANRNGNLGMQLPLGERERERFVREAVWLASPGMVDHALVQILANEAEPRFRELEALGLKFRYGADGRLLRRNGCFSPFPRAAVFDDLAHAHGLFQDKAVGLGVRFRSGLEVLGLEIESGRVAGARLRPRPGSEADGIGDPILIRAKAVVMALGGPAPLAERHTAGPGNPGLSWQMLQDAGARMENTDYLQYFWMSLPELRFRSPAEIAGPDAVAMTPDGREVAPSAKVLALADARRTHCPAAWGPVEYEGEEVHDYGMDQWLQAQANERGVVRVKIGKGDWEEAALFAHAGNGGALINAHGAVLAAGTDQPLPGLFACGECATGMHGANRLGGAMVTATQVYGKRAGEAAARLAMNV
ncbi:FAD-dependent oxidoreductase [Paucidesulfovibrio longus]|uniref:FAD-dependent oxidoreductase n=1 Tax=Paucidesulfovibrio longus TaxID=889 RepID=UPI0003FED554|nr:FAD-dependent oxidoreductase [Paucidesulfovibrio longus]